MSELSDHVATLAEAAARLAKTAGDLHREAAALNARLQPLNDLPRMVDERLPKPLAGRASWPIPDALNLIEDARTLLRGCEAHLAAIRATMNAIMSDRHRRDEFKRVIEEGEE